MCAVLVQTPAITAPGWQFINAAWCKARRSGANIWFDALTNQQILLNV
jgi:hypothetical protein